MKKNESGLLRKVRREELAAHVGRLIVGFESGALHTPLGFTGLHEFFPNESGTKIFCH
jgi:hypothetical protein